MGSMALLGSVRPNGKTPREHSATRGAIHEGSVLFFTGSADTKPAQYARESQDGKPDRGTARPHPDVGRGRSHEHIIQAGNSQGWWTVQQIIAWTEAKQFLFYTLVGGRKAYVGVRRDIGKAPYIRTYADGVWNDNLLALLISTSSRRHVPCNGQDSSRGVHWVGQRTENCAYERFVDWLAPEFAVEVITTPTPDASRDR